MMHFTSKPWQAATPFALALAALLAAGCSSSDDPDVVCNGIVVGGACLKKCDDAACAQGNQCFTTDARPEGFCSITCASATDCPAGYACDNALTMASSAAGTACVKLDLPDGGARGAVCTGADQCDTGHGLSCVAGTCQYACNSTADCPSTVVGSAGAETALCDGTVCKPISELDLGAFGDDCTGGKVCDETKSLSCMSGICTTPCDSILSGCPDGYTCAGDPGSDPPTGYCAQNPPLSGPGQYGTSCPTGDDQCDTANGFKCVGPAGTSDAYCTKPDGCTQDTDCPSGMWCGSVRVWKDDSNVDFSNQPRTCLRREFCAPCETDVDCSFQTNAICVPDTNGEKFCSLPCNPDSNSCILGSRCEDVGDGRTACRPDVGVCHMAAPVGCGPCRVDTDCGANAICQPGGFGWKPGLNWCRVPCGAPDANGKRSCPIAPNGLEMICLDDNMFSLGGPFSAADGNYTYQHCYAPFTIDNSEKYPGEDPPDNVCGNARREGNEECDDGNKFDTDGCDSSCKITPECKFTVSEPNGDDDNTISPMPNHFPMYVGTDYDPALQYTISASKCSTFQVTGSLETAGDVDDISFMLADGQYAWLDSYVSTIGSCANADIVTEIRAWRAKELASEPVLIDTSVPCKNLSDETLDIANGTVCGTDPNTNKMYLGCGSCSKGGVCGVCDEDSGYGLCTRMLATTTLSIPTTSGNLEVRYEGKYKMIRVFARDPAATVANYVIVVNRFTAQASIGPSTPPGLSCY